MTASRLLDALWPRHCEICAGACDRPARYICSDCHNRLPLVNTRGCCKVCGRAIEFFEGEFVCNDCKGPHRPRFDRAGSAMRLEDSAKKLIHAFKFNSHIWLREDFTDLLEAVARERFDVDQVDLVIPVPAAFSHLIDRGYNQTSYLAKALARRIAKPCPRWIARRAFGVRRQAGLDEAARRENAKNSFRIIRPELVCGKTVLLVDDIMTTGATLSEFAKTLNASGATKVCAVTLARSLRQ